MQTPHYEPDSVSREDVVWCYRNLLGRDPEAEAAITSHQATGSFRALVAKIVQSEEFKAIIARKYSSKSNLQSLRTEYHVRSLEVEPEESSPLRIADDQSHALSVHLPSDDVIGRFALAHGHWDIGKPRFLQRVVEGKNGGVVLVDVGANVGLFTRQSLALAHALTAVFAYEPAPENFALLARNLHGIERVRLFNFGLGDRDSTQDLYVDPENCGNCSFNVRAMPESFGRVPVRVVRAADQALQWMGFGKPIFYKSDTQGLDEAIAASLSGDFWSMVCGGIFELWRIPGKRYDVDRFAKVLDTFECKVFEKHPGINVSTAHVIEYLQATDGQFDDLLFWRE